ncbi:MAG: DUF177 domain-containing protein [bacterium]|nr:DUF177 domain-containing protein [bacterium]
MNIREISIEEIKKKASSKAKIVRNIDSKTIEIRSLRFIGNIKVDLLLEAIENTINLTGKINTEVELECNRCLRNFNYPLNISVNNNFIKKGIDKTEGCFELKKEDVDNLYFQGECIDLLRNIREEILLNIPNYSLCKEDCLGFCPKCGIDLNCMSCNCKNNKENPFAILNTLIKEKEK